MSELKTKFLQHLDECKKELEDAHEKAERDKAEFLTLLGGIYDDLQSLRDMGLKTVMEQTIEIKLMVPKDHRGIPRFTGMIVQVGPNWVRLEPSEAPAHVRASGKLTSMVQDTFTDNTQFQDLRLRDTERALLLWLKEFDWALSPAKGGDASAQTGLPELPERS